MKLVARSTDLSLPAAARLPPELLFEIIRAALSSSLLSQTLVIHGQFSHFTVTCRVCVYRTLARVSRTWRTLARQVARRDLVLARGCGSAERDEQVLRCLQNAPEGGMVVRSIDASLRGTFGGWTPTSAPPAFDRPSYSAQGQSTGNDTSIPEPVSRRARWDHWHEQCMALERYRFRQILPLCSLLDTLDADVGFFHDLPAVAAAILPLTLRRLTLRNCGATDTFAIVSALPQLKDLVLRLALDWRRSPDATVSFDTLPRLQRFELSTTAFGKPDLASVRCLLSNSHASLRTLSFRNKGAASDALEAFKSVAATLIQDHAERLEELVIQDVPRFPGPDGNEWLPSRPTRLPQLRHLHLTGLPLPSRHMFAQQLVLPASDTARGLVSLTVEDFDTLTLDSLVEALALTPNLAQLDVALSRDGEIAAVDEARWLEEREKIERWCEEPKEECGVPTRLRASWRMVKIEASARW